MTCGSGCCGLSPGAPSDPIKSPIEQGEDGCCGDVGSSSAKDLDQRQLAEVACKDVTEHDDRLLSTVSISCEDACCDGPSGGYNAGLAQTSRTSAFDDDCCPTQPAESGSDKGCCSVEEPPRPDATRAPSCCEGKTRPCCDQSCLDRLALRECESLELTHTASQDSTSSHAASRCNRSSDGKPCVDHVLKTRRKYAEKLEALGCICRALVALGQESCCNPARRLSSASASRRSKEIPSSSHVCRDSCCAAGGARAGKCSTGKKPDPKKGRYSGDGTGSKPGPVDLAGSCADSCCSKKQHTNLIQNSMAVYAMDPEKGLPGNAKEHVILSISGMTCTGCETKLVRTLGTHPFVRNLKTSLVLSRAEFEVVGAASSVAEVMKHIERTTEFKCERVTNRGSNLDIIAPAGDAGAFVNHPWPDGVCDVSIVDSKTVNVSFDAKVVGARDLIKHGWGDLPLQLAPPRLDPTLEVGSKHVRHVGYMTLLSAGLTIPVLVMAWAPLPQRQIEYASASLALATLVQLVIAGPFYSNAVKALVFSRVIEMDLLVVLSTSAAYIFSVVSFSYAVSGQPLSTGEFFETSTLLVTLIMVGRWVAALARQKAAESISIRSLQTPTAYLVADDGEIEIDARLLQYGDVFKVSPDSRIPTDGTVVYGSSEVDESMVTGESKPVEKHTRSPVIAGSVNGSGILHVRLTRLPGDNTITTIARMVDEAKLSKPKIQNIADRIASYFVPAILALTTITFCIWIAIGLRVRGQSASESTIQAITYAITVLIVSCPCAIGLAVPMVIVISSGVAAERGVIFKSAESIEVAYKTSHVVFDKTGTITEGKLTVVREWYSSIDRDVARSLLFGLLGSIKHPVSAAVVRHLEAQGVTPSEVSGSRTLTGKGVEGIAKDSGLALQAGNSRWLNLTSDAVVGSVLLQGHTAFCFTIGGSIAAIFGLEDSVRSDASITVKTLLNRGISVHIISGDDDGAVRSVAAQLNIAETNVRSRCTPADKQAYIQNLLEGGTSLNHNASNKKKAERPVVIFCGDGTNDAVALAQATIGVHMNEGGTDVAESAADIVLMRPNLWGILTVIAVSKKSIYRIAFNFGWSFIYNLFAILLAAGAFVNARIPPEFAGLGELVSVLPVIAAATLLRWSKI